MLLSERLQQRVYPPRSEQESLPSSNSCAPLRDLAVLGGTPSLSNPTGPTPPKVTVQIRPTALSSTLLTLLIRTVPRGSQGCFQGLGLPCAGCFLSKNHTPRTNATAPKTTIEVDASATNQYQFRVDCGHATIVQRGP